MKARTSNIERLRNILAERINTGEYPSGKKLPGDRKLSLEFNVSRGTVVESLELLVRERLIERIPCSGSFVIKRTLRILLLFPQKTIPFDQAARIENWGIVSEVFRGMTAEASQNSAEIVLQYFPEPENELEELQQLRRLKEFDGLVLLDPEQMEKLRQQAVRQNFPCIQLGSQQGNKFPCPVVGAEMNGVFNRLARLLQERGYRKIHMLGNCDSSAATSLGHETKRKLFVDIARNYGLEADASTALLLPRTATGFDMLKTLTPDEAIFVSYTDFIPQIYRYCAQNKLIPGKNFGLFGYASGLTFVNLFPELTFGKINHFQIGRALFNGILEIIHTEKSPDVFIPGELVIGESL